MSSSTEEPGPRQLQLLPTGETTDFIVPTVDLGAYCLPISNFILASYVEHTNGELLHDLANGLSSPIAIATSVGNCKVRGFMVNTTSAGFSRRAHAKDRRVKEQQKHTMHTRHM
jgi:hypothetical protein